jgi:cbb3-type cytochrome oxidase maturation protein
MSVIVVLLIASVSVAAIFLAAFIWSVKSGQFEDDYSPASRILFEDKPITPTKTPESTQL